MTKFLSIILLFFSIFISNSCKDGSLSSEEQLAKDIQKIEEYLTENNLTAQSTASGLYYIIEEEGNGEHPTINSTVTVHYKGYFLDGEVFDQTNNNPATFPLQNVIEGWQEGIPLFEKGGKGKLFVPSRLAYGPEGRSSIPGNTVLGFDVELVDF